MDRTKLLIGLSSLLVALLFLSFNSILKIILPIEKSYLILSQNTPTYYEVKQSKDEATDWTFISAFSIAVPSGKQIIKYINWQKSYPSKLRFSIGVAISPAEYYTCSWYNCQECQTYMYQACQEYVCTLRPGTRVICERNVITSWKCEYSGTRTVSLSKTAETYTTVKDGPDILDGGDPDYLEIDVNNYPWDALANSPSELDDYYFGVYIYFYNNQTAQCIANKASNGKVYLKIIYDDGTEDTKQVFAPIAADNAIIFYLRKDDTSPKLIDRLEIWEAEGGKIEECVDDTGTQYYTKIVYKATKTETVSETRYVSSKSEKDELVQQGYSCVPHNEITETATFENLDSCESVKYVDHLINGNTTGYENGQPVWYCNPDYECYPEPPRTVGQVTSNEQKTIYASTKQKLFEQGCTESQISCTRFSYVTGTLQQYYTDVYNRDARNPQCYSWGSSFRSSKDLTKQVGEPPFYTCTPQSSISKVPLDNAVCEGPTKDKIVEPAEVSVGTITRQYLKDAQDTIVVDVDKHSTISLTLKGASFAKLPQDGKTIFTVRIEALEKHPYIVSEYYQEEQITGQIKKLTYTATIESPSNVYAYFKPSICTELQAKGYNYTFVTVNGNPVSGNPCVYKGVLIYLQQGQNIVKIEAYNKNPRLLATCIKPEYRNSCEEQDLYGCPEQCKPKNLRLECVQPRITIQPGYGKEIQYPIKIYADSPGYVRISVKGKGVVFQPKIYKVEIGENPIILDIPYYIYANESKREYWKVIVEYPPILNPQLGKPDIQYCEIQVNIIPYQQIFELIKRPEVLISAVLIIIAIILLLI